MAEIRKGLSWGSLLALVLGIGIVCYLAWSATNKSDNQNYTKGATHNETTVTIAPVEHNYPLSLPRCGRFLSVDPAAFQTMKPEQKGKK